jgi:anti-sigma factor RsiW
MNRSSDCIKVRSRLISLTEGTIREQEALKYNMHLSSCTECAAYYQELKATLNLLSTDKINPSGREFTDRVMQRIAQGKNEKRRLFSLPGSKLAGRIAAAAVVIMLGAAGSWILFEAMYPQSGNPSEESYLTPAGVSDEPIEAFLLTF